MSNSDSDFPRLKRPALPAFFTLEDIAYLGEIQQWRGDAGFRRGVFELVLLRLKYPKHPDARNAVLDTVELFRPCADHTELHWHDYVLNLRRVDG